MMLVEEIAKKLIRQKERGLPNILFIGAGASDSAGIPVASGIVKHVKNSSEFEHLKGRELDNYFDLMNVLTPGERKKILLNFIDNSKVNITHFLIGFLISESFFDHVITTNFDPLIKKSVNLFHSSIPAYDVINNINLQSRELPVPSIIHLHGTSSNVWLLNREVELRKNIDKVKTAISQVSFKRATWMVLGYSGNDPVFNELAKIPQFNEGLYWIGYKDQSPSPIVEKKLLSDSQKSTEFVAGYDSDSFFTDLFEEIVEHGNFKTKKVRNRLTLPYFLMNSLKRVLKIIYISQINVKIG